MSQYKTKYLLRLYQGAIPHSEFAQNGKQAVAIVELLGREGLAERVDFDGNSVGADDPDATWQITSAGCRMIGKHDPR